jgi:hypothetical protein
MEPVTIAAATIALLSPYTKKSAEAFAGEAGKAIYAKTTDLVAWIKKKLTPEGTSTFSRFEKDPDRYAPFLEDVLKEQLEKDPEFTKELEKITSAIKAAGPSVSVVIKMKEAEDVTGIRLREHKHGHASANIEIEKGKKVVGYEGDTM